MHIRREIASDVAAVHDVHRAAFGSDEEVDPVEVGLLARLRDDDAWLPRLSLVATAGDRVVGHVTCTRAVVGPERHALLGLGPLGVAPAVQGRGVGSALMHAVLGAAEACDEPLVGLLGAPAYYRRFGFVRSTDRAIGPPDAGWGDAFQVRTLTAHTPDIRGPFRYARPFEEL